MGLLTHTNLISAQETLILVYLRGIIVKKKDEVMPMRLALLLNQIYPKKLHLWI